jgi:hypothetical protein
MLVSTTVIGCAMATCEACGQMFILLASDDESPTPETHVMLCGACNITDECVIVERTENGW